MEDQWEGRKPRNRVFSLSPAGNIPLSTQQRLLVSRVGFRTSGVAEPPRKGWKLGHSADPADGQSCPLPPCRHTPSILCRTPFFVLSEDACGGGGTCVCVYVSLCVSVSVTVYVCMCVSMCICVCLCVYMYVTVFVYVCICVSLHVSVCV